MRIMMATPKRKLSKKQAKELLPIIKEFNGVAKQLLGLLSSKIQQKEHKVNVMVSKIGLPQMREEHQIDVKTVGDMSQSFISKIRKKKKKDQNDGEWDDYFSQKKGFII